MSKHFDDLNDAFDVDAEVLKPVKKEKDPLVISDRNEDQVKDYQHVRAELYNLVDKMQEALDGALEVAQESDHPRAYEVVFNGAKNTADVVDKLADLQKKMNDLDKEKDTPVQQHNTQNNIFMGTTEDVMKLLKQTKKEEKDK